MRVPAFLLNLLTAASAAALVTACSAPPVPLQNAKTAPEAVTNLNSSGEFFADDTAAIAYDRKLAPEGAQASLSIESSAGQTRTSLVVEGLLPDRAYGAHLHTKPCGKKPDEAGPHFQHEQGEISPESEVWLDFTTDAEGAARSSVRNDWAFDGAQLPGSLVIHALPTETSGPQVGQAGSRVACLTLR
ncbi:hypothetical protein GCM10022224_033420 [Nonomuraea antimicrobica]|uniref:Superoxide dismutase copper/zinc binding domain-containing protein n=1 Tax=Nonomuraea antimicrobica TaxID=561173 RepID=A0ABP7BPJ4_9ACTN